MSCRSSYTDSRAVVAKPSFVRGWYQQITLTRTDHGGRVIVRESIALIPGCLPMVFAETVTGMVLEEGFNPRKTEGRNTPVFLWQGCSKLDQNPRCV